MTLPIPQTLLGEVGVFVAERTGLCFPEERWPDLARGLERAGRETGHDGADAFARSILGGAVTTRQVEALASHLTVGETYFLRDPASFDALTHQILPPLIAQRAATGRSLRLWSAGCCTGEEPYSLAIACARALPDLPSWNVSVLGTDINPGFLAKAEAGVYTGWSFRGAPTWLRERHFSPLHGSKQRIDPALRELVGFAYLNLAVDVFPSLHNHTNAMDVIFCRNVLMYFTPEHQRRVVAGLYGCLVEGGCLLVNPAEASTTLFPMFRMENLDGVIVYRKSSEALPVADHPAPAPEPAAAPAPRVPTPFPVARPPTRNLPPPAPPRTDPLATARVHANQGRLDEALAACEAAIAAARTDPAAHLLQAVVLMEAGRPADAVTALGRVLYLDPDNLLAHHALGGLHRREGRRREARRHLAVTVELLAQHRADEVLPGSDGMTCGRLAESARAMLGA